jgi:phage terminase large subunit
MGQRLIDIPYTPRRWAMDFHDSNKRWIVLVLHRRAGKTTGILNHLQRDAIRVPKSQYAFIAPTYKMAKRVAWDIAKQISIPIPGIDYNESELTIHYPNGSKLFLAGSENVDSLRGIPLWGGAQDESSQQPANLFTEVISKALADHLGYWIWAGTPKGKNEFHKTYQAGLQNPNEYTTIFRTIDDTLREEEGETVNNLRQALSDDRKLVTLGQMTQEEYDQEWYCSFDAAIKGAYYAAQISQARKEGRIRIVPHDPTLLVHTVSDLGVGPAFATGFYQRVANELHMIDFEQLKEKEGMPEFVRMLRSKPYNYGKHFGPHDLRGTEIGTGKSRLETAQALGVNFEIVPDMGVDDGINAGRLMFARLFIDEQKCAQWLDAMSQYRQDFDDKRNMFLPKPYHDWTSHSGDTHRYAALAEPQMTNETAEDRKKKFFDVPGMDEPYRL